MRNAPPILVPACRFCLEPALPHHAGGMTCGRSACNQAAARRPLPIEEGAERFGQLPAEIELVEIPKAAGFSWDALIESEQHLHANHNAGHGSDGAAADTAAGRADNSAGAYRRGDS